MAIKATYQTKTIGTGPHAYRLVKVNCGKWLGDFFVWERPDGTEAEPTRLDLQGIGGCVWETSDAPVVDVTEEELGKRD